MTIADITTVLAATPSNNPRGSFGTALVGTARKTTWLVRTSRITSRGNTVADCFKYRNKVGTDVAIEALRECLRKRGRSMDELQRAAEACRVPRVIRPYVEALA